MNSSGSPNASFLLPLKFDTALLNQDLEKCMNYEFQGNYIPENYDGDKYILPLRSINGSLNHVVAIQGAPNKYENTEALDECLYFQAVIDNFQCEKESIRLMSLPAGAKINTHIDHGSGYEDGVFRIHIPIKTNDQVRFILDGYSIYMGEGEAWYTNINLPHGVENNGETPRIHLVIDCIRNDWSDTMFKQVGYDFEEELKAKAPIYSKETLRRMIEELSNHDNEASAILIADLKKQLDLAEE